MLMTGNFQRVPIQKLLLKRMGQMRRAGGREVAPIKTNFFRFDQ